MKNIPIFTGEHGTATLIFHEIPYSGRAYAIIRSVWEDRTAAFLEECRQFCRAAGARESYTSWKLADLAAVHAYDMLTMACEKSALPRPQQPVDLEPLTPENSGVYLEIYNRCFRDIYGAATYEQSDLEPFYDEDVAWLARVDGAYAGVAEISKRGLEGIAVLPQFRGLGYDLALAVLDMVPRKTAELTVCSTNERAIRLYRRLGFRQTELVSRWWKLEK